MPLYLISMTCTVRVCVNIELDATKHKYRHYMSCIPKLPYAEQVQPLELIVIISVITFMPNNCICIPRRSTDRLHRILGNLAKRNCTVRRLGTDYLLTTSNLSLSLCAKSTPFPLQRLETMRETTRTKETVSARYGRDTVDVSVLKHHFGSFYDRRLHFDAIDNAHWKSYQSY